MIKSKNSKNEDELLELEQSVEVFVEYYNKNIPRTFPHATLTTLNMFQDQYPKLFNDNGKWVINKHRKKYMDWLVSHNE